MLWKHAVAGIILLPLQFPTALHLYVHSSPQWGYRVIPLVLFAAAVSLCWTPGWMGGCTASDPSLQLLLWDLASGTHSGVGFRSGSGVVCVLLWHLVASFPCALDLGVKGGRSDSRGGWVISFSSAAFRACHAASPLSPSSRVGTCTLLRLLAVMDYCYEIWLYYPKLFLSSSLAPEILLGVSFWWTSCMKDCRITE